MHHFNKKVAIEPISDRNTNQQIKPYCALIHSIQVSRFEKQLEGETSDPVPKPRTERTWGWEAAGMLLMWTYVSLSKLLICILGSLNKFIVACYMACIVHGPFLSSQDIRGRVDMFIRFLCINLRPETLDLQFYYVYLCFSLSHLANSSQLSCCNGMRPAKAMWHLRPL
jgi:hypothetical protein